MGDRANIVLNFGPRRCQEDTRDYDPIYLYTHWGGTEMPHRLAVALKHGEGRWDDVTYLARIIVSQVVLNHDELTGYGLSPYECDNEHKYIHVTLEEQTVTIGEKTWTYKEYVAATTEEINKHYLGEDED